MIVYTLATALLLALVDCSRNMANTPTRILHAATPNLARRQTVDITEQYEFTLHYVEGSPDYVKRKSMSAAMRIKSEHPTFILEDFDHVLHEVRCDRESMEITFSSTEMMEKFRSRSVELEQYRVLTSHTTCNEAGGRASWNITTVSWEGSTAHLTGHPVEWDYDYTLDFGEPRHELTPIAQNRLQRRDTQPTSTSPSEPTAQSFSFEKSAIDRQLIPVTNSTVEKFIGLVPEGFGLKCKNCTVQGNVDVIGGTIDVRGKNVFQVLDQLEDLKDSFVSFVTNDVFAHIELEASWQGASADVPLPTVRFLEVPIVGIEVPGVARIGVFFEALIAFQATLKKDLTLSYGFQVAVPNNSTAIANLGNVNGSTVTGFTSTSLTPLPFDYQSENLTLSLSAALQPKISLTIDVGSGKVSTGIGASVLLDIPKYAIDITPRTGAIDLNCTEVVGREPTQMESILGSVGNITHIAPSYQIGAGFELTVDQINLPATTYTYSALSKAFSAPTGCVAHIPGTGLVAATDIAVSISSELERVASQSRALASAFATANGQQNFGTAPVAPTDSPSGGGMRVFGGGGGRGGGVRCAVVVMGVILGRML
ncbi:hypothetical protein H072_32 [Dactylellina haptotyla CBS 200.50]|uniref:Uncharacterized protein n=1 Tax=Dactylellina haptotyla (strain CBS 200.50) TaxID=1284197 RepID=S8ASZ7_DACHA|nr:hypothetical protein H072_32 [Dactylellina haptotyla CBS 200.50]